MIYRQAKAIGFQHHQTSFTTNIKGTSLGKKEKATIRHKKIIKWKSSPVKQRYRKSSKPFTHKTSRELKRWVIKSSTATINS